MHIIWSLLLPLVPIYLLLVRILRYSRITALQASYARAHNLASPLPLTRTNGKAPTRKEYPMTPAEAQKILLEGLLLDMPWILTKSLEFALFKTYGIPTISKLLFQTTEFSDPALAGRRYADTGVLIFSFMRYPIVGPGSGIEEDELQDPRQALATARMNWLHGRYKGRISNDDFLYTLSTFALEPQVWASPYEWRPLTPLEEQAWFVFFSEIGRRMGIVGIPPEMQGLIDWAEEYEKENMVPKECNRDVAAATTKLLLHNVPKFLHPLGTQIVSCLLYDRLREAVMLPKPPAPLKAFIMTSIKIRQLMIRHLFLPRLRSQAVELLPTPEESPAFPPGYMPIGDEVKSESGGAPVARYKTDSSVTGSEDSGESDSTPPSSVIAQEEFAEDDPLYKPRINLKFYNNEAWYVPMPGTFGSLVNSTLLALHLKRPDQLPGAAYQPAGFRFEEVGPRKFETKGAQEIQKMAEVLHGGKIEGFYAVGGADKSRCPYRL